MASNFRDRGALLLEEKLQNPNMRRHCRAVEAIMRGIARRMGEDEEAWGLAGLMHDLDYEETEKDLSQHSLLAAEWLEHEGFPPGVVRAVRAHNEAHGIPLETGMEKWLVIADALSGLLVAATLVLPCRRIGDLSPESVKKRLKAKDFAKGVNREEIFRCEQEGLSLDEFISIALESMQAHSSEIGL